MKRMLKLFAGMLSAVIIILSIPVSHADATTPQVINIILGETTTTVKTGQSQYRVYTAPYGLDAGYVNAGETIKVYFKEYSAGTMYYYIEFQGSYGRKRAYIPASSINEVNVITRSFTTTANCYAKTTIPIKNGNTQWFDANYDHTLNSGDMVTVLAQVGRWFMVEHYHNGRNVRGFVDFARIDYYKINEHYKRLHNANAMGFTNLKYSIITSHTTDNANQLANAVALWNDCDGNEDHIGQNWNMQKVNSFTLANRTNVVLVEFKNVIESSNNQYAGSVGWGKFQGYDYMHMQLEKSYTGTDMLAISSHEIGHLFGLADINNTSPYTTWPCPSIMDYQQIYSSVNQRQFADVVGVWDYLNGYYNGYPRN